MAKAKVYCTCKSCGAEFVKEATKRNRREADAWEQWAKDNIDLCPACWKKQQQDAEIAKGLLCEIRLDHTHGMMTGERCICLILSGDTMSHEDEIKALGARWTDYYPVHGGLLGELIGSRTPKRWVVACGPDDLEATVNKITAIGAKITAMPDTTEVAMYKEAVRYGAEKAAQKRQELGPCPQWPADIAALWPEGAKWNGKFYGKPGVWRVYFGGQEVRLTDKQQAAFEEAQTARAAWRKRRDEMGLMP